MNVSFKDFEVLISQLLNWSGEFLMATPKLGRSKVLQSSWDFPVL